MCIHSRARPTIASLLVFLKNMRKILFFISDLIGLKDFIKNSYDKSFS